MAEETKQKEEKKTTEPISAEESKEEAAPAEEASEPEKEVEVPKEFKEIVEKIEGMSVLELNTLVKVFEDKFGVSATAVAAGPAASGGEGVEEQSDFTVVLASMGDQKIAVIKAVKEILGLGLKEAKDLVESAPADLKSGVKKEEAEEMKTKIEAAGASVELK